MRQSKDTQSSKTALLEASESLPVKSRWGAVLAMSLGAFVLIASEFMPVSLLTPIADDLQVSEGQAGQAISVSGVFAVITSLLISILAGRIDRKQLLLLLTLMMVLSGLVVTFAPNYVVFMIGRALIGIAIGGFWSMSAATAIRLVQHHQVPKALALVNGGNALATIVAAPLGSYLGAVIGWRGAFFCIIPVAVITLIWLFLSLPSMNTNRENTSRHPIALLTRPPVFLGMIAVSLFFMGQFALFTFLRPFLETATHADVATLSFILLVIGVAGFLGTVLIGEVLKHYGYLTLAAIPVLMAFIAVILVMAGNSVGLVMVALGVWGLVATAAPVAWWTWLARTLPDDAEAGGGLMVAIIQLAIAFGAVTGGLLFDASGYKATFTLSAVLLIMAAVIAWSTARR